MYKITLFLLLMLVGWSSPMSARSLFHLRGEERPKKSSPRLPKIALLEEDPSSPEQEILFIRRITKLWKDHDYSLVKAEIYRFFELFPASSYRDELQQILGNIALADGEYAQAVHAFEAIIDPQKKQEARIHKWQALYHMHEYGQLYQEIGPLIPFLSKSERLEGHFLYAEAAYREALNLSHFSEGEREGKRLVLEALPLFEELVSSPRFGGHSTLAIAEIHRYLKNYKEAARYYKEAAHCQSENDELLFHAAVMLSQFNQKEAAHLFHDIAYSGRNRSPEAAYQWMQILAKQREWGTLVANKDLFLTKLPSHRLSVFHFYLGTILYEEEKWTQALVPLEKSLSLGLIHPYEQHALFALATCAKKVGDLEKLESVFAPLQERYPESLGEAFLMRAAAYREKGQKERAVELFEEVAKREFSTSITASALREKLILEKELRCEAQALETATALLTLTPDDIEVRRIQIQLSLAQMHCANGFALLQSHLEAALSTHLFEGEEQEHLTLLLAKACVKQEKFKEGLQWLEQVARSGVESAELYSLLALCHLKVGQPPQKIIYHGEKALELDPHLPEADRLHLYIFNAYLDLAKQKNDASLNNMAEKHLYTIIHRFPVSLENRLWLAHRFAKRKETKQQAIDIFSHLIDTPQQIARFPREAFVLAQLFDEKKEYERGGALLKTLQQIEADPQSLLPFQIDLALAKHYVHIGENVEALKLYHNLEHNPEPSICTKARLEQARLLLSLLPAQASFQEGEPVLERFKDLWLKKNILTEPIHLEAAIDYVHGKSAFLDAKGILEMLYEVRDHFTLENDIWSKDYHETRCQLPEKNRLFQAYLRLIEGKILITEAQVALLEGEQLLSSEKRRAGDALLSTLCQGEMAVSEYLIEQAEKGLYE